MMIGKGMRLKLLAEAAADYYDVPLEKLKGRCRKAIYTKPRHICQWAAVQAGYKKSIVARFWDLNHASVVYGCKMVDNNIETDPYYKKEIHAFLAHLRKYVKENE
jgi:chromosomal replication initiator protein